MKGKRDPQPHGNGKRKRWSAAEKLRIVLEGMEPGVEVSELCRREALSPAMYYNWKRLLLGAAERIFVKKETQPSGREQRLTAELTRAKDVIAEITAENLDLKKTFSD
jgi:transposase